MVSGQVERPLLNLRKHSSHLKGKLLFPGINATNVTKFVPRPVCFAKEDFPFGIKDRKRPDA